MEEKINIIKKNLTGDYEYDMNLLYSYAQEKQKSIEDNMETLDAINIVIKELENNKSEIEEKINEKDEEINSENNEVDELISKLNDQLKEQNLDDALKTIKNLISKVEELSKSDDDNKIYCSFSSEFEKNLFENIFADQKEVISTPYSNDVIYIVYSNILESKNRSKSAIDALDRAIYWNFLNREARSKKIDLYFRREEIVKCLDSIAKLQSISYTAQGLAQCYNKYAYVFEKLKDKKSAYALYVLSYYYLNDDNVLNEINRLAKEIPELGKMTFEEAVNIAKENDVVVTPNVKIVNAYRKITKEYIEQGDIDSAIVLVENDYAITRDEDLKDIYSQLVELKDKKDKIEKENNKKVNETKENTTKKRKTYKRKASA